MLIGGGLLSVVIVALEEMNPKNEMVKRKKRRKPRNKPGEWGNRAKKEHMARRLQNAMENRVTLLQEDEHKNLRSIMVSFQMTSIGIRMLWELQHQHRWPVVQEFLNTFACYDLLTQDEIDWKNKKYRAFCAKKRNSAQ